MLGNEIKHNHYLDILNETESTNKRYVTSIRSFKHELFLYSQPKIALTAYYDKMKMLDKINCVPFGYME